jgi:hypothetical protein
VESSCELGNEPSGSIKYWETTVVTAQLVASRAVLSSTELVISTNIVFPIFPQRMTVTMNGRMHDTERSSGTETKAGYIN